MALITELAYSLNLQHQYSIRSPLVNCSVIAGSLMMFVCDNGFEAHHFDTLIQNGSSQSYSALLKSNSTIQSPQIYSTINNQSKISYINNHTFYSYSYNADQKSIELNNENVTDKSMGDQITLDNIIVYRD